MLARAVALAREAHAGQADKCGQPYIGHPLRVMSYLASDDADEHTLVAAVLHDVVEDSSISLDRLRGKFSMLAVSYVDVLTRRRGQDYWEYIAGIANFGGAAVRIKLADIEDNLDPLRKIPDVVKGGLLAAKYDRARRLLGRGV